MSQKPIRVLVVDDSALVRKIATASLAGCPDIEVVGTAPDPYVARDRILELKPDVVTLDIEMPGMDGITFLKLIMKHRPMLVIIMSSLTQEGSEKALEALQAGAVDVLSKPGGALSAREDGFLLAEKIRAAALARIRTARNDAPPATLAARAAAPTARMAMGQAGLALVAPGGYHMVLKWNSAHYAVNLSQGPPIHHQRPAVDLLFDSAVKCGAGPHAVAAVLTGMGADGAGGLLRLRESGASTLAQNEETCVVFGMPREAIRQGAAQEVLPLEHIGRRLEQLATYPAPARSTRSQVGL
jgi:two-component system chemotaxis response regulator CheB